MWIMALGCATLVILAMIVAHSRNIATRAKVEIDKRQVELAFPEPARPPQAEPTPEQQALTVMLERRRTLETQISELRERAITFSQYDGDKKYAAIRANALKALEDARDEQQELICEQEMLLASMKGTNRVRVDATTKSVQPDPGGPVAQGVDDLSELYDAELHEPEAGREGTARV